MKIIGDGGHASVIKPFYKGDGLIIAVGDNGTRKRIVLEHEGMRPSVFYGKAIHPSAQLIEYPMVGEGTVIMANVVVQPNVRIGKHVILNTGCTVDHDCIIEDYAHIAPGAHLCGGVHVGEGALVGVGVGIEPGVKIPSWHVVKREPYSVKPVRGY